MHEHEGPPGIQKSLLIQRALMHEISEVIIAKEKDSDDGRYNWMERGAGAEKVDRRWAASREWLRGCSESG